MRVGPSPNLRCWLVAAAACVLAAAGCGLRTYKDRLERTQRLQEYRNLLDRELVGRPWQNDGFRLRVPRQFSQPADESQPPQLSRDAAVPGGVRSFFENLSGVQGVWRASVTVRGRSTRRAAYIVLASNRNLAEAGRHTLKDAMQYEERLVEAMHHACAQARPLRADWVARELPTGREFAVRRTYTVFTLPAGAASPGQEPYQLRAYCVNEGAHQFALLLLLPGNISEDEQLSEDGRVGLSLGTLATLPD